jgi:hypothetical protein
MSLSRKQFAALCSGSVNETNKSFGSEEFYVN